MIVAKLKKSAFTLIELLVVIAIIALLVSILLPSLNRARDLAKRTVCASNMHSLSTAVHLYAGQYSGQMPTNFIPYACFGSSVHLTYYPGTAGPVVNHGLLYGDGILESNKSFYCPGGEGNCDIAGNEWMEADDCRSDYHYYSRNEDYGIGSWLEQPQDFDQLRPETAIMSDRRFYKGGADEIEAFYMFWETHQGGINSLYADGAVEFVEFDPDELYWTVGGAFGTWQTEALYLYLDEQH